MIKKVISTLLAIAALAALVAAITGLLYRAPASLEASSNPFPTRPAHCVPLPTKAPRKVVTVSPPTPNIDNFRMPPPTPVLGGSLVPPPTRIAEVLLTPLPTNPPVRRLTVDPARLVNGAAVPLRVGTGTLTPNPVMLAPLIEPLYVQILFDIDPSAPSMERYLIYVFQCDGVLVGYEAQPREDGFAIIPLQPGDTIVYIMSPIDLPKARPPKPTIRTGSTPPFLPTYTLRSYPAAPTEIPTTPTPWVYPAP